jgi:starch synthase (maltosyl-transferring)
MGFDVVYLTPIHPIGKQFRKGKNNSVNAQPGEVGCPYAIGSELGGHKAILPELGTLEDFHSLVKATRALNMEVALDFAIQCAPDHPYVKEHPSWFKMATGRYGAYAENPPKKYQDILPVDFETEDWQGLWQELKSILDHWIAQGVTIFRVDNPHTKSFPFWEWCLGEIHKSNPEVLFLSEAFTRPRVMEALAKKGFHQSYTYFTWRNTKQELSQYMHDLTQTELKEYYRPNFWTNTQDILPYMMQSGQLPQFLNSVFFSSYLVF